MAGRGPAPKHPDRRAPGSKGDPVALRVIVADPVAQPELPSFSVEEDGELVDFVWPARTRDWWRMWAESPLSAEFTSTDWSELLDTAILHARLWRGDHKVAGELRLRVAKMGATPEDRLRLRISFAQATEAEERTAKRGASGTRDRRGPLKSVSGG